MQKVVNRMPFQILKKDITKVKADVIVNAANERLLAGSGVCGAIFAAAGPVELTQACQGIGYCATGDAVITPGFSLPAKYIIHTVGPVWHGGNENEEELLYNCYQNSLELAAANDLKSIAFPLISSGIFGYPKDKALAVALRAFNDFLGTHNMVVYLVVLDASIIQMENSMVQDIVDYILKNVSELKDTIIERLMKVVPAFEAPSHKALPDELQMYCLIHKTQDEGILFDVEDNISSKSTPHASTRNRGILNFDDIAIHPKESFSSMLLHLITESGKSDPEIYKAANIDRKLFSKLRKPDYKPSKKTVLQLAIAVELNLDRTKDLLAKAGYAFSDAIMEDLIIMYFIENKCYDTIKLEAAIFQFCGHYWAL